jgi:hypothetical protein
MTSSSSGWSSDGHFHVGQIDYYQKFGQFRQYNAVKLFAKTEDIQGMGNMIYVGVFWLNIVYYKIF